MEQNQDIVAGGEKGRRLPVAFLGTGLRKSSQMLLPVRTKSFLDFHDTALLFRI